jgi:hypothetical protein
MNAKAPFKKILAGLVAAGALALSANAQAVTIDAGILGNATNPYTQIVNTIVGSSFTFTDTINFDLGTNQFFNMRLTPINNILPGSLGAPIFENSNDNEIVASSDMFTSVFLPDLGLPRDYHIHPTAVWLTPGVTATYEVSMWGSPAPVPVPAAVWLFASGLVGLVGLARRKMRGTA